MKRTILIAALALAATVSQAQTFNEALLFGQTMYTGTAKSMAMGNALASVGGDPGSIGINPAGSAVCGYSQLTLTPGLSISSCSGAYAPTQDSGFGPAYKQGLTRFNIPNVGVSLHYDTYRDSGLKGMTFSFVANSTNNFTEKLMARGANDLTSKFAEFANAACGIDRKDLSSSSAYSNFNDFWDVVTAYNSGLISSYGKGTDYIGAAEYLSDDLSYHYIPGALNQTSEITKYGNRTDIIINWGLNFSDRLFVGFNIGIPTMTYRYIERYSEAPQDASLFPVVFEDETGKKTMTTYRSGAYQYCYNADANGIYAKLGFIYLPTDRLRLAAAIQTPTAFTIAESWQHGGSSSYADKSFDTKGVTSPLGEYRYSFRAPYVVDAGVSYVFGGIGLVSVDYEMTDFSIVRFSELDYFGSDGAYRETNRICNLFGGVSHELRAGAEVNLNKAFALRAGFTMKTSPERYYRDENGTIVTPAVYAGNFDLYDNGSILLGSPLYYNETVRSYSAGIGYKSEGSFFLDLAARMTRFADYNFYPYYTYPSFDKSGHPQEIPSPVVKAGRRLWNVALTIGWRF